MSLLSMSPAVSGLLSVGSMVALIGFGLLYYAIDGRTKRRAYEAQVKKNALRLVKSQNKREQVFSEMEFLKQHIVPLNRDIRQLVEHLERDIEQAGEITSHVQRFWNRKLEDIQEIFAAIEVQHGAMLQKGSRRLLFVFLVASTGFYLLLSLPYMHAFTWERYAVWAGFGFVEMLLMLLFSRFLYIRLYMQICAKLAKYAYWIPAPWTMVYALNKLFLYGCIALTIGYFHLTFPYIFLIHVPGVIGTVNQILGGLATLGEVLSIWITFSEVKEKVQKKRNA